MAADNPTTIVGNLEPATDASPCSPRLLAPAPYQRPGPSAWEHR
jgi:hypothetical protein